MNEPTALEVQKPAQFVEQNVSMVQQVAQAQIQSAYVWAERHPRDWDVIEQQILKECRRPQFVAIDPDPKKFGSSTAMYGVPRGGEFVNGKWVPDIKTGLTIRFAEMALPFMKNIQVDLWPLGEDDNQRIFRAVRIDYESNNVESEIIIVQKAVERKRTKETDFVISTRTNSTGNSVFLVRATDEETDQTKRALYSKVKRNLVLSVIPGWLREAAKAEIRATQRQVDAEDPDAARKRLYAGFAKVGVSVEDIKKYIGHQNDLNPAELEDLRVLYAGIAEGNTTWKEILAAKEEAGEGGEDLEKKRDDLFAELEMPPAQIRKQKVKYLNRDKELIAWLEGEVAKKRNDGGKKQDTPKADPPKEPDTKSSATVSDGNDGQDHPKTNSTSASEAQKTVPTENPDAEPPADLFSANTAKPGPVAVEKPKAQAPPPLDLEGWV
jgi:hypothetical protein